MLGAELLLKQLGIDPKEVFAQVQNFGKVIVALKEQMDRIERKLDDNQSDNDSMFTQIAHINDALKTLTSEKVEKNG